MPTEVLFLSRPCGTADWELTDTGARLLVDCCVPPSAPHLLRCYGKTAQGEWKRLCLPEPCGGRLHAVKQFSGAALRELGMPLHGPEAFCLSVLPPEGDRRPPDAADVLPDDPLLRSLLSQDGLRARVERGEIVMECPLHPAKPFLLAPAFCLCTVHGQTAALRAKKKDAEEKISASLKAEEKGTALS